MGAVYQMIRAAKSRGFWRFLRRPAARL